MLVTWYYIFVPQKNYLEIHPNSFFFFFFRNDCCDIHQNKNETEGKSIIYLFFLAYWRRYN